MTCCHQLSMLPIQPQDKESKEIHSYLLQKNMTLSQR